MIYGWGHVTYHVTHHVTYHVTHQVTYHVTHHVTHLRECTRQSPTLCYSK